MLRNFLQSHHDVESGLCTSGLGIGLCHLCRWWRLFWGICSHSQSWVSLALSKLRFHFDWLRHFPTNSVLMIRLYYKLTRSLQTFILAFDYAVIRDNIQTRHSTMGQLFRKLFLSTSIVVSVVIVFAFCWHSLEEIHYLKSFYPKSFTVEKSFYASAVELVKVIIVSLPF